MLVLKIIIFILWAPTKLEIVIDCPVKSRQLKLKIGYNNLNHFVLYRLRRGLWYINLWFSVWLIYYIEEIDGVSDCKIIFDDYQLNSKDSFYVHSWLKFKEKLEAIKNGVQ